MRRRNRIVFLATAGLFLLDADASAANKTWAAGSGSWSVGANWNPANAPASGDAIFLTSTDGASRTVTYDNPSALIFGNTLLNAPAGGTFTLQQSSLTNVGATLILGTTGRGIYQLSGGTVDFDTLNVATAGNSFGTFAISGGSAAFGAMNIGVFNSANVTVGGGVLSAGSANISQSGAGTVTHSAGRFNVTETLTVSDEIAGGTARYDLQGGTLTAASVVINNGGRINHTGGAINTTTLTLNSGGIFSAAPFPEFIQSFLQNGGTIDTDFLVGGGDQLIYTSGAFPNRLDSLGRVTFNGDMTMGNGWRNRFGATIDIAAARTITASGTGLAHGHGTLTLNGTLNTTDTFVGGDGVVSSPQFVHQNGSHNVSNTLQIGKGFAAGTYTLNAGTLNVPATSAGAFVGVNHPGQLNILNGRANIATLSIGAGAAGTINHTGSGDVTGSSLIIGDTAPARYIHNNAGASLNFSNFFIAKNPGAEASEYVLGSGTFAAQKGQNNGTITATGGRLNLSQGLSGSGTLLMSGSATLTTNSIVQGFVRLGDSARVITAANGNVFGLSSTDALQFEEPSTNTFEGQFDLNDNALIINYDGPSPLGDVFRYIRSGFANGSWNGAGLSSAAAAVSPNTSKLGLGYIEAADRFATFPATFFGTEIDDSTALVRCVLLGDTDLNATVDISDFARLAAKFNLPGDWNDGDFNYDGTVNISDFALLAANFNQTLSSDLPRVSSVPEPLAIGCLALCVLRRRRKF